METSLFCVVILFSFLLFKKASVGVLRRFPVQGGCLTCLYGFYEGVIFQSLFTGSFRGSTSVLLGFLCLGLGLRAGFRVQFLWLRVGRFSD